MVKLKVKSPERGFFISKNYAKLDHSTFDTSAIVMYHPTRKCLKWAVNGLKSKMEKTIKNPNFSRCINPFKKEHREKLMDFPCGKCVNCKKRRVSGWSFRLMQQHRVSNTAWFITFTYTTETVPISPRHRMTLDKRDFQLFMKRLRKLHQDKISYYTCGEYGTEKYRPHYHAIMFNVELKHLIGQLAEVALLNRETMLEGKHHFECPLWGKGHITIGTVSPASVGYTLEYISKPQRIPQYKGDDREPEFSLMSKGIGKNYLSPEIQKWHKDDFYKRYYLPLEDGKKACMPRYYTQKMYTPYQRRLIGERLQQERNDEKMTKTKKQRQKEVVDLNAYRNLLATTGHREKRSLKY